MVTLLSPLRPLYAFMPSTYVTPDPFFAAGAASEGIVAMESDAIALVEPEPVSGS
uniref:Uncharacterized protein n=1 Tax=Arundo donax TaxID=35708 RepID=A0A0A9GRF5_ARUDO